MPLDVAGMRSTVGVVERSQVGALPPLMLPIRRDEQNDEV